MVKQISRFFLVLFVSVIVSGSIYLLVTRANGATPVMENQPGLNDSMYRPDRPFGEGDGFRQRGGEDARQVNLTGILLNLAKVTAVTTAIVFISKLIIWRSKKKTLNANSH